MNSRSFVLPALAVAAALTLPLQAQTSTTTTTTTTQAEAVPVAPAAPATPQDTAVGLSSRDGITVSGTGDVLVTRNGVSQTLRETMSLPNGVKMMPDGSFVQGNNDKVPLRPGQILTFDGKLITAPVVESGTPAQVGSPK